MEEFITGQNEKDIVNIYIYIHISPSNLLFFYINIYCMEIYNKKY